MSDIPEGATPFDFRTRQPEGPLGRFVESIWYARGTVPYRREKITPTGSTVAVFVLGDPILQTPSNGEGDTLRATTGFLIGPHDRPTVNEPTGETFAVGIVTTPVGCEALFGLRPTAIRGRAVDLEAAWAPATELLAGLRAAVEPVAMLDLVEHHLAGHHGPTVAGLDRCERAVELLEADPVRPIADIAAELGLSHGHLDREFTRVVGLTPRSLARLLRMRRLLQRIDVRGDIGWSDHAAELGWFDQAHLIRDFKRHTGVTPSYYLEAQRATYTTVETEQAVGFVPEE
ncbi:MAG: helix-turn-helix domain-containing protein [Acidimicrobiales bacterium]